jgi:sarcosine oxidase, subunit gamma
MIRDQSGEPKTGLKGPGAAAWLASQGIEVPALPNTWKHLEDGVIGRLAETEFFVEGGAAAKLTAALREPPAGVYPVPREDACFALWGNDIHEVLLQICSSNFQSQSGDQSLFLTSMAGVPVLAIPQQRDGVPTVRLWCDPTFGPYLWHTLSGIVQETKNRGGP